MSRQRRITEQAITEDGLSAAQELAALSLAGGRTLAEAAAASGSAISTIKTWLYNNDAFKSFLQEQRREMSARVMARMVGGMVIAVDTLEKLCLKSESETTKLRASEILLTHGITLSEVNELKSRILALEGSGKASGPSSGKGTAKRRSASYGS